MVSRVTNSVTQYLADLPGERRQVVAAVRRVIRKHLPPGYRETLNWGMISYEIPLRFRRLEDLPLGVIGRVVASTSVAAYIARYEASRRR